MVKLSKMPRKRFSVTDVDEYRTSRTCNMCMGALSTYLKRDGRRSYSRLCCSNCGRPKDRSKRFVDRDSNAAVNILLCGTSCLRPEALRRRSGKGPEKRMRRKKQRTRG